MNEMPRVDLDCLRGLLPDPEDQQIALLCLRSDGQLRASKPTITADRHTRIAAYAWRMAAFSVSANPRHQCMPVTADMDLPGRLGNAERKVAAEQGDRIEQALVHAIPVEEWHGVRRWGQAFGLVGTPRVREGGTIVYR